MLCGGAHKKQGLKTVGQFVFGFEEQHVAEFEAAAVQDAVAAEPVGQAAEVGGEAQPGGGVNAPYFLAVEVAVALALPLEAVIRAAALGHKQAVGVSEGAVFGGEIEVGEPAEELRPALGVVYAAQRLVEGVAHQDGRAPPEGGLNARGGAEDDGLVAGFHERIRVDGRVGGDDGEVGELQAADALGLGVVEAQQVGVYAQVEVQAGVVGEVEGHALDGGVLAGGELRLPLADGDEFVFGRVEQGDVVSGGVEVVGQCAFYLFVEVGFIVGLGALALGLKPAYGVGLAPGGGGGGPVFHHLLVEDAQAVGQAVGIEVVFEEVVFHLHRIELQSATGAKVYEREDLCEAAVVEVYDLGLDEVDVQPGIEQRLEGGLEL